MPKVNIDPHTASDQEIELAQVTEWQWKEEDDPLFKDTCMAMLELDVEDYRAYLIDCEETRKDAASLA